MSDKPTSEGRAVPALRGELPPHPVRAALLELLRETGTVTATEGARRLGYSSGLCSFHLRQLARHGVVEEVTHTSGRVRPWRLRPVDSGQAGVPEGFDALARGLEDESYQRWLAQRDLAPASWQRAEAFSVVVYLTPREMGEVADAVRRLLARYQDREWRPSTRPDQAAPVAMITRLFPLLPGRGDQEA